MDNNSKIINHLAKNHDKTITMHSLSNTLRIPYASFYRTIQQMEDLLEIKRAGRAKILKLDTSNPVIRSHLAIASEQEKKEYVEKQPIIRKISHEIRTNDVVLLFGSYAKQQQTTKSDIDLMIINRDGKKSIPFSKYETIFNKKINPIFMTRKEFITMLKDKDENVAKQALKNHIVLNNPEEFWRCVLDAIR